MAISISTYLRNYLLDGGSLEAAFNDSCIVIYSGTVPASADAAVTGNILAVITEAASASLTFATAASGSMTKSSNTWSGTITGSGTQTATHWRLVSRTTPADGTGVTDWGMSADTTSYPRVQGTIGTSGADGNLSSTSLTNGGIQYIDYFSIGIPAA